MRCKLLAYLLLAVIPWGANAASPEEQIKLGVRFVVDNFGPQSGLANFGCNSESMAYLDSFINRQNAVIKKDAQTTERFVSLFGSFLGECIVFSYRGAWVVGDSGIHVEVRSGDSVNILQPFQKVARRIEFGEQDSLLVYYRDMLPGTLGQNAPAK